MSQINKTGIEQMSASMSLIELAQNEEDSGFHEVGQMLRAADSLLRRLAEVESDLGSEAKKFLLTQ